MRSVGDHKRDACGAFTLVEFILVMALLATVMAFAAPQLSRFFRQRDLEYEAGRLRALTEMARNEAISQGVPMVVRIDPETRFVSLEPREGYPVRDDRRREYELNPEIEFDLELAQTDESGLVRVAQFAPNGELERDSTLAVWLVDRQGEELVVAQRTNRWGYEIVRPEDYDVEIYEIHESR